MTAIPCSFSCMFTIAFLAAWGNQVAQGFQRTKQVSSSEAALRLAGGDDAGAGVAASVPAVSSNFGADPQEAPGSEFVPNSTNASQKATVHVTIDIAALPKPDNATIIAQGIEGMLALMNRSVSNATATVENLSLLVVQGAQSNLSTMVLNASNSTCGVLDGVVEKTAEYNCSFGEIYKRYEHATALNTTPVMVECIAPPNVSAMHYCTMKVDSGVANASMRKLCASGMQQLLIPAFEKISTDVEACKLAANTMINAIMENFSNFTNGVANSTEGAQNLTKAVDNAIEDFSRSLSSRLQEVVSGFRTNFSSQIQKTLNATKAPLENYSNNTAVFAKEIFAAANSSRLLVSDMKLNLAFANISLDHVMALSGNFSDVALATKLKIQEANEALKRKDQARDSAAYFINVSLNESAAAAKAMTMMADPDSNMTADYVAHLTSSAKAAVEKAGELSEQQVQAEMEHKTAMSDSKALAMKEYFLAREMAGELQDVLTRVARALDDDATEINRTLGFFNSSVLRAMDDALKDHQAGMFPITVNISIPGDNFSKAMKVLEKAGIDIQGIQAGLLQIDVASGRTEAKPGNVTVNVTVEGGDETLLKNISTVVLKRLKGIFDSKAAFDVSYDVHKTSTGGEVSVHAILPDVTSITVKRIVNTTQIAIQDVMGKGLDEEVAEVGVGVVGSSEGVLKRVDDDMTEVVHDSELAGEAVFGKPKAPQKKSFSYWRLNLMGIFVLVVLGTLVLFGKRVSPC